MHLEKDILKGKFGRNKKLIKEAREELRETKKGKHVEKALEKAKKVIGHGIGYHYSGKKYKFPIHSKKEIDIIRNSGGEIV